MIPSKSVFALSPECCMLSGEATNPNLLVFGLTRSGLEATIYRTRWEHDNHYTTDAVEMSCASSSCITVYNRVRQQLFGFNSGQLGRTSGHERWAHFLKILLSRNELITQALHLSFSRYSFASKHMQC
jgi:hypothetical protein